MSGVAVVLGSAFRDGTLAREVLEPVPVFTAYGEVLLHRWPHRDGAWVLARHGAPHRYLPHQIPYRAHTAALRQVGVTALMLTTSVGVLVPELPLFRPMLVADLWMPENRLPGGGPCTMWPTPAPDQGHLVLEEGLFSRALSAQVGAWIGEDGGPVFDQLVFAYQPGPRTKTPSENRHYAEVGAHVNSMSIGPEVVLANELEMSVVAVAVGHKRSGGAAHDRLDDTWVTASLEDAREATERLAVRFLSEAQPTPFRNRLYRFGA